jgi:hypothetical protein
MASSNGGPKPASDETTPLLATGPIAQANEEAVIQGEQQDVPNIHNDEDDDKPLPRGQIFLLCYARLVEPIAFFAIFPFINKMIWETGDIDEADVGFYSGLIVCMAFL